MEQVTVIDYGMGNLRSVAKAVERAGEGRVAVAVSDDTRTIGSADRVVFPGQGAIRDCMARLKERGLTQTVAKAIEEKPFFGICLGLQALVESSEECPDTPGLCLLAGEAKRFPLEFRDAAGARLKVPHMGWNRVRQRPHALWAGIPDDARFYFVHSYYVVPAEEGDGPHPQVFGTTDYGFDFVSAMGYRNWFAVQFHPEKSQRNGLRLLKNFLDWDGHA